MSENADINCKYTFWKLLNKYRIQIPRMQRDYAQGRSSENATAIRVDLLESIHSALINKCNLDFDFVYGTVVGDTLYPLDGQQRLTTFYLLHWYLAEKENRMDMAAEMLSRFSYETRISSREFCNLLVGVDYTPLENQKVSSFIRNENGYFAEWDTDPTISHMLTMLDAIHEKFYDADVMFDSLISENDELLTFSYLPMEHYALTDDLYIKMNARGKALTDFENFKAKFIQHLKQSNLPYEHFESCIDSEWTDLLWDYRDDDNTIDDQFMNLFCFITEMLFLESAEPQEGDSPFRSSKIRPLIDFYDSEEKILRLYSYLDLWKNKSDAYKMLSLLFTNSASDINKVRLFDNRIDLFSVVINGESPSLIEKLLLFATMKRLCALGNGADIDSFRDYIRVIRNFLLNTRSFYAKKCIYTSDLRFGRHAIPIMQHFINVLTDETDIYSVVSKKRFSVINSEILELERQKAKIILEKHEMKRLIQGLENLDLFKSTIANIIPYIINNSDELLIKDLRELSQYMDPRLLQALLSINDYGIRIGTSYYGDRYYYGCINNWHSIFTYSGGKSYSDFICSFIEQYEKTKAADIDGRLDEIITTNINRISKSDWRYTIVKYYNTVRIYPDYIDNTNYVFAKEELSNGRIVVRRINGFILMGYHVVPDYLEIREQLGNICGYEVRSFACDQQSIGNIELTIEPSVSIQLNDKGQWGVKRPEKYKEYVTRAIEKYRASKNDEYDNVEKAVLLCRLLNAEFEHS